MGTVEPERIRPSICCVDLVPEATWDEVHDGVLELAAGRADAGLDPLVLIPPIFGPRAVLDARSLAAHIDPDRRMLLLDLQGRTGAERPLDTVSTLATHYLDRLRAAVPAGPVVIAGHSLGGPIALEMARQLGRAGAGRTPTGPAVDGVVMFDSRIADHEVARLRTIATRPLRWGRAAVRARRGARVEVGAEVRSATRRAWLTYRPRPYAGRVVYLAARGVDGAPERLRRDERWAPLLPAMEVIEVGGGHSGPGSLLDEPHVARTAEVLQQALVSRDRR